LAAVLVGPSIKSILKTSIFLLHKAILWDIVTNMKTTIDISDSLFLEAKKISQREHTTLRSLIEDGLRQVVKKHDTKKEFRLRRASFKGNGMQAEFQGESWQKIRSTAYEGHGG
jgi:hypothetical protein